MLTSPTTTTTTTKIKTAAKPTALVATPAEPATLPRDTVFGITITQRDPWTSITHEPGEGLILGASLFNPATASQTQAIPRQLFAGSSAEFHTGILLEFTHGNKPDGFYLHHATPLLLSRSNLQTQAVWLADDGEVMVMLYYLSGPPRTISNGFPLVELHFLRLAPIAFMLHRTGA